MTSENEGVHSTIAINFSDFYTTLGTFRSIEHHGRIPNDFMGTLQILLKHSAVNPQLRHFLTFHWDETNKMFQREWDMETIRRAMCLMEMWQEGNEHEINAQRIRSEDVNGSQPPIQTRKTKAVSRSTEPSLDQSYGYTSLQSKPKPTPPPRRSLQRGQSADQSIPNEVNDDASISGQNQEEEEEVEDGPILKRWQKLIGQDVNILQPSEFTKVGKILFPNGQQRDEPFAKAVSNTELTDADMKEWIRKSLPYFIQKIKMWGGSVVEPKAIEDLVKKSDDFNEPLNASAQYRGPNFLRGDLNGTTQRNQQDQHQTRRPINDPLPLSRIDVMTCVMNCVDIVVAQDLLRNLASFPVALPLIIPSIFEKKMINLLPLLKYVSIRSRCSNGDVEENYLFTPPYKMILAIRLGKTEDVGKSCIMNCLLKRKYTFSSKQEPGADFGKPVALPGLVEFVPLTEETCSSELWKELSKIRNNLGQEDKTIILANMHGDPSDHSEVFKTVSKLASGVIIFAMPQIDPQKSEVVWQELVSLFGDELPYLQVAHDNSNRNSQDVINTGDLNNDVTLRKVRQALLKTMKVSKWRIDDAEGVSLENVGNVQEIQTIQSKNLANIVRNENIRDMRSILSNLTEVNTSSTRSDLEDQLLGTFRSLLTLPLRQRILGFLHFQKELSDVTNKQSCAVRNELYRLQTELTTTDDVHANAGLRENLKRQMTEKLDLLSEYNVGLEHFYRKLGSKYVTAAINRNDPRWTPYLQLPQYYADLLIHGHAIELMDGESSRPTINAIWFTAICEKISAVYPNLRIFVVSIIGLQSSGKSTLLNALFGCKFAVSVGRCTRGLFLRLLFLDDELKQQLNADAIFVIDMEGLGSPEKVNDPEFEKKDRLMTTFVMGISNLTLINISGESSTTMTDILQIAIVSMARVKDEKMSTDMFVVQYLSERNPQRVSQAHGEFIKAIEKAIDLTEKEGVFIGIQNCVCMKNLMHRAKKGNVLKAFGPFRNGEHVNSPPSVGYHESVVDLYKSILEACKECESKLTLHAWSELLNGYLEAVHSEDLVVRFKNLIEMCEHLDRGNRISETKEAIEKAFRHHVTEIEPEIRREIQIFQERHPHEGHSMMGVKLEQRLLDNVKYKLEHIPSTCGLGQEERSICNCCEKAATIMNLLFDYVRGKPVEEDTVSTVRKFIETTKESSIKRLENMIGAELLQQGLFKEFHEIINESLAKFSPGESLRTEGECLQLAEIVWEELVYVIEQKYPYTSIQERIRRDITSVYENYPNACVRYMNQEVVDLENYPAYRNKGFRRYIQTTLKPLKPQDCLELKSMLNNLPERFVQCYQIEHYSTGLMISVRKGIEETIETFEKQNDVILLGDFKWEAHVYALKKFGLLFHRLERRWESVNQPRKMLEKNEEVYKEMILTRLRHGFSASGEGYVIANLLLNAVAQKAMKHATESRVNKVLDLAWINNSENVRLRYYSRLAHRVNEDNFEEPLRYFCNPKQQITDWFKSEVDSKFIDECDDECRMTFENDLDLVIQNVRNKHSMTELKQYLDEYFTHVGSVIYQSSLEDDNVEGVNFDIMKSSIEHGIRDRKSSFLPQLVVKNPSESETLMARLGCTEHCYWCGALCWGQRGHDTNQDSTKNHHACHQPSGLIGVHNRITDVLWEYPCHDYKDNLKVYWGEYSETGLLWGETKQHDRFKNWLFDKHTKVQFNQLMYWFFKKVNVQLATKLRLQPAPVSKLTGGTYDTLNSIDLDQILAAISPQVLSA